MNLVRRLNNSLKAKKNNNIIGCFRRDHSEKGNIKNHNLYIMKFSRYINSIMFSQFVFS